MLLCCFICRFNGCWITMKRLMVLVFHVALFTVTTTSTVQRKTLNQWTQLHLENLSDLSSRIFKQDVLEPGTYSLQFKYKDLYSSSIQGYYLEMLLTQNGQFDGWSRMCQNGSWGAITAPMEACSAEVTEGSCDLWWNKQGSIRNMIHCRKGRQWSMSSIEPDTWPTYFYMMLPVMCFPFENDVSDAMLCWMSSVLYILS